MGKSSPFVGPLGERELGAPSFFEDEGSLKKGRIPHTKLPNLGIGWVKSL